MEQHRFEQLWARCAIDGVENPGANGAWFGELDSHYRESHRHYHRPEHIEHCLRQFDAARAVPGMEQPDAIELAIWYHDAIYVCGDSENELKSAELFKSRASDCLRDDLVAYVYDLILVTMHDRELPKNIDQGYMVDIDLSSFGLPWDQFLSDSRAVRGEFEDLGDADFYPGQYRFFEMLLAREHFCFTEFFRNRHGAQARENIQRYLNKLYAQGYGPANLQD